MPPTRQLGKTTTATTIYGRVAHFCARHAYAVISLYLIAASVSLAFTIVNLTVNTDPGRMIASDLSFRKSFARYVEAFPSLENTFVVVIDADDPELGREAAKSLAQSFSARAELFQDVYAPGISKYFDDYGILYQDTKTVQAIARDISDAAPLLNALTGLPNLAGLSGLTGQLAQAAAAGALPAATVPFFNEMLATTTAEAAGQSHPLDWQNLGGASTSLSQKRWFVIAKPRLDYTKLDPAEAAFAEARLIVADPEIRRSGKIKIALTGEAAVNAEEFGAVIKGATIAGVVSLVLVTLIIFFGLPVARLILPALAMLVLGFMLNAGFATLAVGELNMISVAFAVLFIGLGIDYAVHLLLRYAELGQSGVPPLRAIATAADGTGPALALCTLTTSLAFLAFVPTDFAGMAQLGIIAAGGIVIAFIASLTLLPAALGLVRYPEQWRYGTTVAPRTLGMSVPSMFQRLATLVAVAVALACLLALPMARFDGDPVNLKDPQSPAVIAFKDLLRTDSGQTYALQLLADTPDQAVSISGQLRALPLVESVRTIQDLLPTEQGPKISALNALGEVLKAQSVSTASITHEQRTRSFLRIISDLAAISAAPGISSDQRAVATRLHEALLAVSVRQEGFKTILPRLENALFAKLPQTITRITGLIGISAVDIPTIEAQIRNRFITTDGRWRIEITGKGDMRDEARLQAFVKQVREIAPDVTGAPVEITGAADVVATAIIIACLTAFGLVILVLVPILRRLMDISLVIAPIAVSALLLVGYTVLFNSPFNFANVIVLPLLLGLGIDSAIHYVMRAREARSSGISAVKVSETSTPRAVLISALTTIGSFGTLWLSPHRGMASMGELLTIAIFITLLSTLIVLPQLIKWTIARSSNGKANTHQ